MIPDTCFDRDQSGYADGFVAGEYLHRRSGHVSMPVRCWWGPPLDLENGGEMDRSPRWNVTIAGVPLGDERQRAIAEFGDVWPRCLGRDVGRAEVDYRDARIDHARRYDDRDPFGERRGRIDLLDARPPF